MPHLEIAKVVLVHFSIVNNNYEHDSRVLYKFVHNKSFGTWMTTFLTNPYFITFQRLERYTILIVKELLYNNKIKFFTSIRKSVVTYITIAVTNI